MKKPAEPREREKCTHPTDLGLTGYIISRMRSSDQIFKASFKMEVKGQLTPLSRSGNALLSADPRTILW